MAEGRWTIEGKTFRTAQDYQAGLRDKEKIDALLQGVDLNDPDAVVALSRRMGQEDCQFESALGRDFDDEIYERAQAYRKQGYDGRGGHAAETGKKGLLGSRAARKSAAGKATGKRAAGKNFPGSRSAASALPGSHSPKTGTRSAANALPGSPPTNRGSQPTARQNPTGKSAGKLAAASALPGSHSPKTGTRSVASALPGSQPTNRGGHPTARQTPAGEATGNPAARNNFPGGHPTKTGTRSAANALPGSHPAKPASHPSSLADFDPDMRKIILAEMKKQEKRRRRIVAGCAVVALLCFAYFGGYSYFAAKNQNAADQLAGLKNSRALLGGKTVHRTGEEDVPDVLEEYKTLYNMNKSLIGWLKIDDTIIDYPVMQTKDNEYYLTHNFDQERDNNGCLFLDTACDVLKPSTNLIVYGHHMRSGKMFGDLNKYSSKDYAREHSRIQFDTIYEKGTYQVMFVFRSRIFYEDEITFKYYQFIDAGSAAEFDSAMASMADMALFSTGVTASYGDRLLTLSTCDNSEEDGRFVVVAKRIS